MIVASDQPLPVADIEARVAAVAQPAAVVEGRDWSGTAQILRDDHAPVDQLLGA